MAPPEAAPPAPPGGARSAGPAGRPGSARPAVRGTASARSRAAGGPASSGAAVPTGAPAAAGRSVSAVPTASAGAPCSAGGRVVLNAVCREDRRGAREDRPALSGSAGPAHTAFAADLGSPTRTRRARSSAIGGGAAGLRHRRRVSVTRAAVTARAPVPAVPAGPATAPVAASSAAAASPARGRVPAQRSGRHRGGREFPRAVDSSAGGESADPSRAADPRRTGAARRPGGASERGGGGIAAGSAGDVRAEVAASPVAAVPARESVAGLSSVPARAAGPAVAAVPADRPAGNHARPIEVARLGVVDRAAFGGPSGAPDAALPTVSAVARVPSHGPVRTGPSGEPASTERGKAAAPATTAGTDARVRSAAPGPLAGSATASGAAECEVGIERRIRHEERSGVVDGAAKGEAADPPGPAGAADARVAAEPAVAPRTTGPARAAGPGTACAADSADTPVPSEARDPSSPAGAPRAALSKVRAERVVGQQDGSIVENRPALGGAAGPALPAGSSGAGGTAVCAVPAAPSRATRTRRSAVTAPTPGPTVPAPTARPPGTAIRAGSAAHDVRAERVKREDRETALHPDRPALGDLPGGSRPAGRAHRPARAGRSGRPSVAHPVGAVRAVLAVHPGHPDLARAAGHAGRSRGEPRGEPDVRHGELAPRHDKETGLALAVERHRVAVPGDVDRVLGSDRDGRSEGHARATRGVGDVATLGDRGGEGRLRAGRHIGGLRKEEAVDPVRGASRGERSGGEPGDRARDGDPHDKEHPHRQFRPGTGSHPGATEGAWNRVGPYEPKRWSRRRSGNASPPDRRGKGRLRWQVRVPRIESLMSHPPRAEAPA